MAKPTTRVEFADYCLRALGAPVVEINIDEDQLDDRIDEAIQYFREFNSDGILESFYKHQITSDDITNGYIDIPDSFIIVTNIVDFKGTGSNFMSAEYQMELDMALNMSKAGSLTEFTITRQHLELLNMYIGNKTHMRFSRHMNRVFMDDWGDLAAGQYLVLKGYEVIDQAVYADIWNDRWLKRYCTALIKRQWGINLKKFGGMQLPGGVTIEAQVIYDEAESDILRAEEEIRLENEEQPFFFVG